MDIGPMESPLFERRDDDDWRPEPVYEIPPDLLARQEIEDAVAEAQGLQAARAHPDVAQEEGREAIGLGEETVDHRSRPDSGIEPIHGSYPYEEGTGTTDLTELDPPSLPDPLEEIRASIEEEIAREREEFADQFEDLRRMYGGPSGMDDGMPGMP